MNICSYNECNGCRHKNMSFEESLAQKTAYLHRLLSIWKECFQPIQSVSESESWGYRRKVTLSVSQDEKNGWQSGLKKKDEIIAIPKCPVHFPGVNQILKELLALLPEYTYFPLAYYNQTGGQVTLVLKTKKLPDLSFLNDDFFSKIKKSGAEGLWIHLNPSAGRRLFEKVWWHRIWGEEKSVDYFGLLYGPATFQQLIPSLLKISYELVLDFFNLQNNDIVTDLYCGTGISLKNWTTCGAKAIGVELGGEAIRCAELNVPGAVVLRGKCEERIPQLNHFAEENKAFRRLLYTNPPRTGIEPKVTEWICNEYLPEKIAYMSCSAGTLSRDLKIFENSGYIVKSIIPFDFFPHTHHVETLVLIERSIANAYVI